MYCYKHLYTPACCLGTTAAAGAGNLGPAGAAIPDAPLFAKLPGAFKREKPGLCSRDILSNINIKGMQIKFIPKYIQRYDIDFFLPQKNLNQLCELKIILKCTLASRASDQNHSITDHYKSTEKEQERQGVGRN